MTLPVHHRHQSISVDSLVYLYHGVDLFIRPEDGDQLMILTRILAEELWTSRKLPLAALFQPDRQAIPEVCFANIRVAAIDIRKSQVICMKSSLVFRLHHLPMGIQN